MEFTDNINVVHYVVVYYVYNNDVKQYRRSQRHTMSENNVLVLRATYL